MTLRIAWFVLVALTGCATAPRPLIDQRILDENGCLIDVDWRPDGTMHQTYFCEAK
jgi:hypothetical protein